jgi:hypothetical protein
MEQQKCKGGRVGAGFEKRGGAVGGDGSGLLRTVTRGREKNY